MDYRKVIESFVYNLFKYNIELYLISKQYDFLCKENHVPNIQSYLIRAYGFKDYRGNDDLLVEMLCELYVHKKDIFDKFIIEFLKGYRNYSGPIIDIDKIKEYLSTLETPIDELEYLNYPPKNNLIIKKEGIFFEGQSYDSLKLFNSLFKNATNSIIIIDRYIDESILEYFENKNKMLLLKILTKRNDNKLFKLGKAFNDTYSGLEIRESDKFHDRFIIIDSNDFYHIGASINDKVKRCFMFSRIEEKVMTDKILDYFNAVWNDSKIIL